MCAHRGRTMNKQFIYLGVALVGVIAISTLVSVTGHKPIDQQVAAVSVSGTSEINASELDSLEDSNVDAVGAPVPGSGGIRNASDTIIPDDADDSGTGCRRTLTPTGTTNQTIRCDGRNWVASSSLLNDGANVSVGALSTNSLIRLYVQAVRDIAIAGLTTSDTQASVIASNEGAGPGLSATSRAGNGVIGFSAGQYKAAVQGTSEITNRGIGVQGEAQGEDSFGIRGETNNGTGTYGVSESGTGVVGKTRTGTAVRAISESGYGFFQTGESAKNYFEGRLGIGGENAQIKLYVIGNDDNGTAIVGKMGAEGRSGVRGSCSNDECSGIQGHAGGMDSIAVEAEALNSNEGAGQYGFYQKGSGARNNFEGSLSIGYLGAPAEVPTVEVQVNGGVQIVPARVQNPCTAPLRGTFWFTQGAPGVADTAQVCAKTASSTYVWRNLF